MTEKLIETEKKKKHGKQEKKERTQTTAMKIKTLFPITYG